uniref:Uncharacterized protein n=1 Tax=Oncorhynchus kisutch TaxID=8019 RepID=A0A8C7D8R7_ONCKI
MADEIAKAQAGDNKEIPAKILFEDDLFIHNKCKKKYYVFPKISNCKSLWIKVTMRKFTPPSPSLSIHTLLSLHTLPKSPKYQVTLLSYYLNCRLSLPPLNDCPQLIY